MKTNLKAKDLRDQPLAELEATYLDTRKQLFQLRNGQVGDESASRPHLRPLMRKNIARLLTVIREKQLAERS